MKKNTSHFYLLFFVMFLAIPTFAQNNYKWKKIDEYNESKLTNSTLLKDKTQQFIERLKKEPDGIRALILVRFPITGLSCNWKEELKETYESVRKIFEDEDKSLKNRITVTIGKYTYPAKKSFEFWLISENSEMPKHLYLSHEPPPCCGTLKLNNNGNNNTKFTRKTPLVFTANILGNYLKAKISYKWQVSAGKIISGQNTNEIIVDVSETDTERIMVTVFAQSSNGIDDCKLREFSYIFFKDKSPPILFGTYSEKSNYDENILTEYANRFAEKLKESPPTTRGAIIYYTNQYKYEGDIGFCSKKYDSEKRYNFVRKLLTEKNKISPNRIAPIYGMLRESTELEFWIVPQNSEMPKRSRYTTPHFYECGTLTIYSTEQVKSSERYVYFSAEIVGGSLVNINYDWKVSTGKIAEGQGKSQIKVDISNVKENKITATVDVKNDCTLCHLRDSYTVNILQK